MGRDEALRILKEHHVELEALGVKSLALFGSVAREEARPDSDVDLLVELNRPMGMFGFVDIKVYLEVILGRHVDLTMPSALIDRIRDRVLRESVRAG